MALQSLGDTDQPFCARKLRDEKILGAPIDEPEFSVRRRDDPVILDLKILIRKR
jgi:hypothetical protein